MDYFAYQKKSRNLFVIILVPLERRGSRGHFELLPKEIHRRSSEKASLEVGKIDDFLLFSWVHRPLPHEEISITMQCFFITFS